MGRRDHKGRRLDLEKAPGRRARVMNVKKSDFWSPARPPKDLTAKWLPPECVQVAGKTLRRHRQNQIARRDARPLPQLRARFISKTQGPKKVTDLDADLGGTRNPSCRD